MTMSTGLENATTAVAKVGNFFSFATQESMLVPKLQRARFKNGRCLFSFQEMEFSLTFRTLVI